MIAGSCLSMNKTSGLILPLIRLLWLIDRRRLFVVTAKAVSCSNFTFST